MSVALQLPNSNRLRDFLRLITQSQTAYAWGAADRVYIPPRPAGGRRRPGQATPACVWLPQASLSGPEGESLQSLAVILKVDLAVDPPDVSTWKEFGLDQLLQACSLARMPQTSRVAHDLLIAMFAVDHAASAHVYASIPKNPAAPPTLLFLERAEGRPDFVIQLPQADLSFPWAVWLEGENRRLATRGGRIRLYHRVGEGDPGIYVEHGWVHPIPNLDELYSNPEHAHTVLIGAASSDGRCEPWCLLTAPGHVYARGGGDDGEAVDLVVSLAPTAQPLVAAEARQPVPLQLTATLEALTASDGEELHRLNHRIQGLKTQQAEYEQQRLALLEIQRRGYRLLLRFRQPRKQAPPRLAPSFEKFLILSRRQTEDFQYLLCEDGDGGDAWHVLLTRETVFDQDVHRGLADEVYYQLPTWQRWGLNVFVLEGCRLTPRVETREMAEGLMKVLLEVLPAPSADAPPRDLILLLSPDPARDGWMRIMTLPESGLGILPDKLEFLNAMYRAVELQCRCIALTELTREAEDLQLNLESQITAIEDELKSRATARLSQAQEAWKAVADPLEHAAADISRCSDGLQIMEAMLSDFAGSWRDFVDRTLELNRGLIAAKLEALQALDREEAEWGRQLEEVQRGNQDLAARLSPLREDVGRRLAEASAAHATVRAQSEVLEAEAHTAEETITGLRREAEALLSGAQATVDKVERARDAYQEKERALRDLQGRLAECRTRLKMAAEGLQVQLDQVKAAQENLQTAAERTTAVHDELTTTFTACHDRFLEVTARVETLADEARSKYETAGDMLERLQKRQTETTETCRRLTERVADLEQQRAGVEQQRRQCQTQAAELTQARDRLARETAALVEARADWAKSEHDYRVQADVLLEMAGRLHAAAAEVQPAKQAELDQHEAALRGLSEMLRTLAELELTAEPLGDFRRHVEVWTRTAEVWRGAMPPALAELHQELAGHNGSEG